MNKKKSIYLLYIIMFLQGLVFYGPISTLYRQAHGITVFQITIIESISLVLTIIFEIPWGYIADRIGYRKTLIICNIIFFASKIVFWKADSFMMFLAERIMLAVVFSGFSGCDTAYLYLLSDKKDSQKVFGRYEACGTSGLLVASAVYSVFIGDRFSLAGLLTVIAYAVAMVLSFFLYDEASIESRNDSELETNIQRIESKRVDSFICVLKEFFSDKSFLLFLIACAMLFETNQTITVFLNQIQFVKCGIDIKYMGFISILVTISGLSGAYTYRISDKLGDNSTVKLAFIIAGISCFIMCLSGNPFASVICIVTLRVASTVCSTISIDIENKRIKTENRATILSIYSCIMNSISVILNLVYGKLADINIAYAMGAGAAVCLIGFMMYSLWNLKYNKAC